MDDLTAMSDSKPALQTVVSTSDDYSCMEHYLLQPIKSVLMHYPRSKKSSSEDSDSCWTIYGKAMPLVEETSHMGLLRSSASDNTPVLESIKKARRVLYSLMPGGLHGNTGLDPEMVFSFFKPTLYQYRYMDLKSFYQSVS